jgi:hypothetical protein
MRRMKVVRVVVAEAAAADAPVLAPILEADGFEIVGSASSADELREVLARTEPQVIVFDAGMSALTVLSTRDWAPGVGIVVVWPADVLAPAADERVEPSHATSELGDAVHRAMRVYHAPYRPAVPAVVPVAREGREAAGKMDPRRTLTFAMASLLILLAVAAVALQRGHQSGVVAQSPSASPSATAPTGPSGPTGPSTPGGNGSGQPFQPPVFGFVPSATALGEVASTQPTRPLGPTVPGGRTPGPSGPGPEIAPNGEFRGSGRPDALQGTGNNCFNGNGDSGHHGNGDSGYHGDGDSGHHGDGDSGHHGDGDSRRGNCGHHGDGDSGLHGSGNSDLRGNVNSGPRVDEKRSHPGNGNSGHHANGHSAGGHKGE